MEPIEHALETVEVGKELTAKLTGWAETGISHIPNLTVAILVLISTYVAAKVASRVARKVLPRIMSHHEIVGLSASTLKLAVWAGGVFMALNVMDLDKTVMSLLAGLGIMGLALGFAFQDMATNFMSGVMLALRRPFKEGDIVKTGEFTGIVDYTDLRAVHLRQFTGEIVIIPNKEIFQKPMVNFNAKPQRRVDIEVGVAYGDDLELAKKVVLEAIHSVADEMSDKAPEVYFTGFGGSSIDMAARFWVDYNFQPDFLEARSRGIVAIKKAIDDAGLTIPFPIRTLDFGVVGGEKLNENLHLLDMERATAGTEKRGGVAAS